jgi:hypothetical protein
MKTQINQITNGGKIRIGVESVNGGTNANTCKQIMETILAENGENLTVEIEGFKIQLQLTKSTTGKSWSYTGKFPIEIYKNHLGNYALPTTYEATTSLTIGMDGKSYVSTNGNYVGYFYIQNNLINIL